MMNVGEEERGFVRPELCQKSLGLSEQFFFSLAIFGGGVSVDDVVIRDGELVPLNYLCVYGFPGLCTVS